MIKRLLVFAAALSLAVSANAQTLSTTKDEPVASMESTGIITEFTPDTALVLDTGSGEPVHFKFARNVQYVDSDGKVVQAPGLRKNLRVRVHYIKEGGDMMIDKVTISQ